MRNTPFYNFLPSKAEEEYERVNNVPHIVTSHMVETREDGNDWSVAGTRWTIFKLITSETMKTLSVIFSLSDVHEHIYTHWPQEMVDAVELYGFASIKLLCLKNRARVTANLEKKNDGYHIGLGAFCNDDCIAVGDGIMMYYDRVCDALCFHASKAGQFAGPSYASQFR